MRLSWVARGTQLSFAQSTVMTAMYNRAVFLCCGAWIRSSLNALNDISA